MRKLKDKKCKICGKSFVPFNSLTKVCGVECSIEYGRKKAWEKEKKERIEKLKTHSEREKELEPVINEIVLLIDKGLNCISCGAKVSYDNRANAGHRFAVGGNNTLRFNLHNIFSQNVCCNKWKNGNPDGYDEGLISMYGKDYYEYVKFELKRLYPQVKLTAIELMEKRAIAMKIRNELKKADKVYSPSERIELRNKINEQIGIYPFGFEKI
jgi:hypothetical protein